MIIKLNNTFFDKLNQSSLYQNNLLTLTKQHLIQLQMSEQEIQGQPLHQLILILQTRNKRIQHQAAFVRVVYFIVVGVGGLTVELLLLKFFRGFHFRQVFYQVF
jgi:hypothetical protein